MPEIPTFPPRPSRLPLFLGIILLGAVSGVVGTLLLFWLYPELRQAQIPPGSQAVIIQQPGKVVVEEGTHLSDVRARVQPLVAEVFHSTDAVTVGGTAVYPASKRLGYAVILTSDGWFGTVASLGVKPKDILVLSGKAYTVSQVTPDPASSYVIGKLTEGSFSVTSFLRDQHFDPGMTVFAITAGGRANRFSLWSKPEPLDTKTITRSSDILAEGVRLVENVAFPAGTPIFDLGGSLMGLIDTSRGTPAILPSSTLESLLNHVLATKTTGRPALGLRYAMVVNPNGRGELNAIIYAENPASAVDPKGAAAKAKLKLGDKIISINGTTVNQESASVFSILQDAKPGQNIKIDYEREGQRSTASVDLGEIKNP